MLRSLVGSEMCIRDRNYAEPSQKIIEIENDLNNLPEKEEYFMHSSVLQYNRSHSIGVPDTQIEFLPLENYPDEKSRPINSYFASYGKGEGWMGHLYANNSPIAENTFMASVNTPFVFDNGEQANITFKVLGLSRDTAIVNNHHLQVFHNNQLIVEDRFNDYAVKSYAAVSYTHLTLPTTPYV